MKTMMVFLMTCVSAISLAQQAAVVSLDTDDSAKAAKLYQQMKDAEKAWADFQADIGTRYVAVRDKDPDSSWSIYYGTDGDNPIFGGIYCIQADGRTCTVDSNSKRKPILYYRKGFDLNGFLFSKDFRFLVPKPAPQYKQQLSGWTYPLGSGTVQSPHQWDVVAQ